MSKPKFDLDKLLSVTGMQAAYDNAIQDAAVHGTGYVMISADETGMQAWEVDPQRIKIDDETPLTHAERAKLNAWAKELRRKHD